MSTESALQPLLIELLTEELPPKVLKHLGQSFSSVFSEHLIREGICAADVVITPFAAPRRLAVHLSAARSKAPDRLRREKLLPVAIALDADGKPTAPLIKKLAGLDRRLDENLKLSDLERVHDGKQEVFFCQFQAPGVTLKDAAQAALEASLSKLPIPKVMNYQRPDGQQVQFVRPAHRLLALHGPTVLPISILGLQADRLTEGHRFHVTGPLVVNHADDYESRLSRDGRVIPGFAKRRELILSQVAQQAAADRPVIPDDLVDEVTSLVEWPVVLAAHFDASFLSVPQECLILTMQQNQKYFALTDAHGRLVNRFLLVSNIESKDPSVVTSGNERVLRARLSDAAFFFDQDRKKPLISRLEGLAQVVYHNKIGSQRDRVGRMAKLAQQWAGRLGADPVHAHRAALLAKCDLLTDMVGEFPELQGTMGSYYALHDQEAGDVARAIEGHYRPRFSGDALADTPTGLVVALADKLETLVGIWGIGLAPTGDKDPFALRRHALGVVRMLAEAGLACALDDLLRETADAFSEVPNVQPDLSTLHQFVLDRMRAWLKEKGYTPEEIEAVLAISPHQLSQVLPRLEALRRFMLRPEAQSLCAANKRIANLLKKSPAQHLHIDATRLEAGAETELVNALKTISPKAEEFLAKAQYAEALNSLAGLKTPVDAFFDSVMVMADDTALRQNRIALMHQLHVAMNQVADLSRLAL